jgi:hypothetical protein
MAKTAKAVGGKKLAGIKGYSTEMSLDLEIQGMALTFGIEQTIVYPDKYKSVQKTPFGEMVQAYDGEAAWMQGPMGVQDVPGDGLDAMKEEISGSLITLLRDPGVYTCQVLEQEELDGVLCDRVYVPGDGSAFTLYFIDAATSFVVMEQGKGEDPMTGSPVQQKIKYADYKDFGGYMRPGTITILHDDEHFAAGEMKAFAVNPKLDDGYFAKP